MFLRNKVRPKRNGKILIIRRMRKICGLPTLDQHEVLVDSQPQFFSLVSDPHILRDLSSVSGREPSQLLQRITSFLPPQDSSMIALFEGQKLDLTVATCDFLTTRITAFLIISCVCTQSFTIIHDPSRLGTFSSSKVSPNRVHQQKRIEGYAECVPIKHLTVKCFPVWKLL